MESGDGGWGRPGSFECTFSGWLSSTPTVDHDHTSCTYQVTNQPAIVRPVSGICIWEPKQRQGVGSAARRSIFNQKCLPTSNPSRETSKISGHIILWLLYIQNKEGLIILELKIGRQEANILLFRIKTRLHSLRCQLPNWPVFTLLLFSTTMVLKSP